MRTWWITVVVGLATWGTACSKECASSADCGGNQMCTMDGECVPRSIIVPTCMDPNGCVRDAGFRDAGPRDAGRDGGPCLDDGGPCDAGVRDGGPTDGGDGGAGDAGFPDVAIAGARGTLWIQEQISGATQSSFVMYAELVDESQASYLETVTNFPDGENTSCDLVVRRLTGGSPRPILTDRIEIDLGGSFSTIVLQHTSNGRYEPVVSTMLQRRMFERVMNPVVTMIAGPSGAVFTAGSVPIPIPIETVDLIPAAGTMVSLATLMSWNTAPAAVPVIIEASDRDREVVLTCAPFNDGGYMIPATAQQAWASAMPTSPKILEIRRDAVATARALVPGMGYVPVTIRTSWAPVFPLTP